MAREPESIDQQRRALGEMLAEFRKAANLTQEQLANATFRDRSTVTHIEKGRGRADERFWQACDDAVRANGVLLTAFHELAAAKQADQWHEQQARLAQARTRANSLSTNRSPTLEIAPGASWAAATYNAVMNPVEAARGAVVDEAGHLTGGVPQVTVDVPPAGSAGKASLESGLAAIGQALMTFPVPADSVPPAALLRTVTAAHDAYQGAQYLGLARELPGLIAAVADVGTGRTGQTARSHVYLVTAKLLTKIGDPHLAHLAADRALQAALQSGHPELASATAYQVACTVLKTRGAAAAEEFSTAAFERAGASSPTQTSTKGALALISAVASARRGDPAVARDWLDRARDLADALGTDANLAWTAFGPTNVRIHEVSVAADLDQPERAIKLAAPVDTDLLPRGLRSRRGQLHIDSAWAYTRTGNDPEAVINLLEAERFAPQTVRHSPRVGSLVTELLDRRKDTPGLRSLARRVGVAA
ncbi:helix-turn-helix protein [Promicromonospora sp. AC04]|uniref:helix-turn-helix domain-containing protein n=1 Tax=Promicromonospora sp. AC04 TaxID=2135723 RepID=UPI000D390648|nr:helix-turn-helix transcriptional regulator [Promicromonospora sp. AC04]PUB20833.1 helix-turn-helix protein [Promicromonospora sp. AC04]